MKWLKSFILIMFCVSFVVAVHEFGHLVVAKLNGIPVESFNIGFGDKLFGFQAFDIAWNFNTYPLGGFVKITGNLEAFTFGSIMTLIAGPFFSFLLAEFLIFTFYYLNLKHTLILTLNDKVYYTLGLHETNRYYRWLFPHTGYFYHIDENFKSHKFETIESRDDYVVTKMSSKECLKKSFLYTSLYPMPFIPRLAFQKLLHFSATHPTEENRTSGPLYLFYEIVKNFSHSPLTGLAFLANFSLGLGIFNLLPLYPSDGGKLMAAIVGGIGETSNIPVAENVWLINLKVLAFSFLLVIFVRVIFGDIKRLWKEIRKK